jgi:hypothetical protein
MEAKINTIKNSNFRKTLLEHCKTSFDHFFMADIKDKRKEMD